MVYWYHDNSGTVNSGIVALNVKFKSNLRDACFTAGIPSVARVLAYMDAVGHQLFDVKH